MTRQMPTRLAAWLRSTPNRTFVLYPLCVVAVELIHQGGSLAVVPWGVPLLAWGYLQYRLVGRYRLGIAKGGPGLATPPEQLVVDGPYGYVRNPMYLGHLIFLLGLAITFWSWLALALFAVHVVWFDRRARGDEASLAIRFGAPYADYKARVKRWIPGVV